MHRLVSIATLVALVLIGSLAYGASDARAIAGTITLTIQCTGNPERSTIANNTDTALPLGQFRLGTLDQPRGNEPFALGNTLQLAPGASITFVSGSNATPSAETPRLTEQFIYDDNAANEGARLTTPYGELVVLCSAGSGSLNVGPPAAPSQATTTTTTRATTTTMTTTTTTRATTTTATAMPGLPNTGGGGGASHGLLVAVLAVVGLTLAGGGALVARRRF